MKTIPLGPNLTQLVQTVVIPVNAYLVREDDGLTLVDTGLGGNARAVMGAARAAGLEIRRVALTHAHGDHTGSLDALRDALPDAEVLVSARDARFLAGDRSLDPTEPRTPPRGDLKPRRTRPTRLLRPGDRVGSLEAVAAPGHTPGQLAFLDTRDGALIAGDAFSNVGGLAVSGVPRLLFPFPALATWHRPTALESARRLRALGPTRLAVGHGAAIDDPLAAMDRAIEEAERALRA